MRYLEVVALVGAAATTLEPHLPLIAADVEELRQLPGLSWPLARLVVLHPGASDPRRRWPPAAFAWVGERLAAAGAQLALIGTETERGLVEAVKTAVQAPVLDLCGRLSLGGLAALLRMARLVVGNDSGPLHLAEAVGTATVGIYWAFNALTAGPLTRARHRLLVAWQFRCPVCGRDCLTASCSHSDSFVSSIRPEEVLAEALALFRSEEGRELHRQEQDAVLWQTT
ncbi:glycosyltransferase family 9 protein [Thermogemmatispora carboxidivorans]|uniref:glycosyltransferase family 9 protein n=1 Tax=Thermogemmatispora carboxidivorans TaxID=1382306 RepID=UPI00069B24B6|nr:glycosyltransferase family 9 protein [Thermogemmatispora carboxidivorans]